MTQDYSGESSPLIRRSVNRKSPPPIDDERSASFIGTTGNTLNAILGSGVLGLPFAVAQLGLVPGLVFMTLNAFIAGSTLSLLAYLARAYQMKTYEDLGSLAAGRTGFALGVLSVFLQNWGNMIAFGVLIIKTLSPVVQIVLLPHIPDSWSFVRSIIESGDRTLIAVMLLVIVPLAILPNVSFLAFTSYISIACVLTFVGAVVYRFFCPFAPHPSFNINWFTPTNIFFEAFPILTFAFACHSHVCVIWSEFRADTKRTARSGHLAMLSAYLLYLAAALLGYLSFGGDNDTLLNDYSGDPFMNIIALLFTVALVGTYPLIGFSTRRALNNMIFGASYPEGKHFWKRHLGLTAVLYGSVTFLAIVARNLSSVLSLTGATASVLLMFILPGLFYLRLEPNGPSRKHAQFVLVYGLIIGPACFVMELIHLL